MLASFWTADPVWQALAAEVLAAVVIVAVLPLISAPYGRHERPGWGPTVSNVWGWVLMEAPASLGFAYWYAQGPNAGEVVPLLLFTTWQVHYAYRAFIYPFRLTSPNKRMPLLVALLGTAFNTLNAYVNATWVAGVGSYAMTWLVDPRFVLGTVLFFGALATNRWADRVLVALRSDGGTGYRIPHGGLYRYVSCPNYLAEIVQWCGWALATWSPAGLAFALYTAANLAPRAVTHHRWYRSTFPDYPPERRALLPWVL